MRKLLFFILFVLAILPCRAFALSSDWQRDDAIGVRLISGSNTVGSGLPLPLGLEVELAEGWHTYWRSPGAIGMPPTLDWKDSQNLKSATLQYPAPKRYIQSGMETIGYRNRVVFPIEASAIDDGQALQLKAYLDILICNTLCVPKHFTLSLEVPAGAASDSAEKSLIVEARAQLPKDEESSGLHISSVERSKDFLQLTVTSDEPFDAPDMFIESDQHVVFEPPIVVQGETPHIVTFSLALAQSLPQDVTMKTLNFNATIVDGDRAVEKFFQAGEYFAYHHVSFVFALLTAVLGGFILNFMPCVLPVLSLKILRVVHVGCEDEKIVRRSFLVTSAGILASLLVMAFATIALKAAGHAVGWGMQFQQPGFLLFLIVIIAAFAANLLGLYEIQLPQFLSDRMVSVPHSRLIGDFLSGAFAALLATPCSAPFLGTAVGFALAKGVKEIIAIFLALGLGMILPYLLVAAWPRLATRLPRPGHWMLRLKKILGFVLALTALWLAWVFAIELTSVPAASISAAYAQQGWRPFAEESIERYVNEGRVVFVDVAADWCLTCKTNKQMVIDSDSVSARLFHNPDIVLMYGDWTRSDAKISDYMRRYGHYGVPFNVVYGPGAPNGIVLPEILTRQTVFDALDRATKQP